MKIELNHTHQFDQCGCEHDLTITVDITGGDATIDSIVMNETELEINLNDIPELTLIQWEQEALKRSIK